MVNFVTDKMSLLLELNKQVIKEKKAWRLPRASRARLPCTRSSAGPSRPLSRGMASCSFYTTRLNILRRMLA
jgi:hypothetical protein